MGRVKLKIYASLGQAAGREVDIDFPHPSTLASLLRDAAGRYDFADRLFDDSGHLRRNYTILLNGTSIYYLEGADTLVRDGDEIVILAFVAGG